MSEPYENYVQYFIPEWEHLISINKLVKEANVQITFSKDKSEDGHPYSYLVINTKNRKGVWNTAQARFKCTVADDDFMAQLHMLETVSLDAQIEFLFNPL